MEGRTVSSRRLMVWLFLAGVTPQVVLVFVGKPFQEEQKDKRDDQENKDPHITRGE